MQSRRNASSRGKERHMSKGIASMDLEAKRQVGQREKEFSSTTGGVGTFWRYNAISPRWKRKETKQGTSSSPARGLKRGCKEERMNYFSRFGEELLEKRKKGRK